MSINNPGRLTGKTCFVTGAAQGIGSAIAQVFAANGADVIASDIRFSKLDGPEPRVTRVILDVTNDQAVMAAAREHAKVSVLVNCVGYVAQGALLESSLEDLDRSYALNVRSIASTARAFLPAMLDRRSGSIINIASVVSSIKAAPDRFAYGTSKAAVIGLTMSIARDYIARGIRCNAICPGTIDTPSLHDRFEASGDAGAARDSFIARQPMGRLGHPEEIAATALLLASDDAQFMTGSSIVIDGGMSL